MSNDTAELRRAKDTVLILINIAGWRQTVLVSKDDTTASVEIWIGRTPSLLLCFWNRAALKKNPCKKYVREEGSHS